VEEPNQMIIVSINFRGLGDVKWKYLKDLPIMEKPGIICVQETKLENVNVSKCYNLWEDNDI